MIDSTGPSVRGMENSRISREEWLRGPSYESLKKRTRIATMITVSKRAAAAQFDETQLRSVEREGIVRPGPMQAQRKPYCCIESSLQL